MQTKITELNLKNLPIIKETSLHKLATTVKLYQEFNELCKKGFEKGKAKFEEKYDKSDPKSLDRVCYKKHYKNGKFDLIKNPETGEILEIGGYLRIETDKNNKITKIESLKSFYWQMWSFKEDVEREDWSRGVEKIQAENHEKTITGNFTPDNGELEKKVLAKFPKITKEQYESNLGNPFVKYDFGVNFGSKIEIGDVHNLLNQKVYFVANVSFYYTTFTGATQFGGATFTGNADFEGTTFTGMAYFEDRTFTGDADFRGATFTGAALFVGATFTGETNFENVTFTGPAYFEGATFTGDADFRNVTFTGPADFGGATFTGEAQFEGTTFTDEAYFEGATFTGEANFGGVTFNGVAHFGDATFTGVALFLNAYFKTNFIIFAKLRLLGAEVSFINDEIKEIEVNGEKRKIGKIFRDIMTLKFSVAEVGAGARLIMDYCDFSKLIRRDDSLKELRDLKDTNGGKVFVEGENNKYTKYSYTQTFNIPEQVQSLFRIFANKKAEFINILEENKVQVSFKNTRDSLSVTYESDEDLDQEKWQEKMKNINIWLIGLTFQKEQISNQIVQIGDKTLNKFLEKKLEALADFVKKEINIENEFGYWKLEYGMELIKVIFQLSDVKLENKFIEEYKTKYLIMSQKNTIAFNAEVKNLQLNQAHGDILNPIQNNNPSLEETSKFLEKLKPTKNKFILTFLSVIISSALSYFINQLPTLQGVDDIHKWFVSVVLIAILAVVTYILS